MKEQNIMEIAARTVFWTDSETVENNVLQDMETGDILRVKQGETMQVLNSTPSSLPQLDNIRAKWDEQYSRATSTFEAVTGETMPSGTPFRALAIQNQESTAMFQYRMEEAGIFWRMIFTDWIVPHLKSKLSREHILASDYTVLWAYLSELINDMGKVSALHPVLHLLAEHHWLDVVLWILWVDLKVFSVEVSGTDSYVDTEVNNVIERLNSIANVCIAV